MNTPTTETIITQNFIATVESGGGMRGAFAKVDDPQHPAHGTSVFASVPHTAILMLIDKVEAMKAVA
jgi:hypothetical protein